MRIIDQTLAAVPGEYVEAIRLAAPTLVGAENPVILCDPAGIRGEGRRVGLVEGRGWRYRDLVGCRLRAVADPVIGEAGAC